MTKIEYLKTAGPSPIYTKFMESMVKEIAKTYGLSYEQLTAQLDRHEQGRTTVLRNSNSANALAHLRAPEALGHWSLHAALDHLKDRGYVHRHHAGWVLVIGGDSIDLTAMDAQAMLYCYYTAGLQFPRGIGWTNLVDHAFGVSANRYVMTGDGGEEKAPEALPAEPVDDFNSPPEDLIGTLLRHTGNGKTYQIIGSVWLGESDQWGYLHRAMGERGPTIARPLPHIKGKRRNGEPRYEIMNGDLPVHAFETAEARRKAAEPDLLTHYEGRTPDDGVIRLSQWPEGYILYYHGEAVWRSWTPDAVAKASDAPQFKPSDLDVLKHALRLWKQAGEGLGIGIRKDYVDRLLNTALAHTDLDPL